MLCDSRTKMSPSYVWIQMRRRQMSNEADRLRLKAETKMGEVP